MILLFDVVPYNDSGFDTMCCVPVHTLFMLSFSLSRTHTWRHAYTRCTHIAYVNNLPADRLNNQSVSQPLSW